MKAETVAVWLGCLIAIVLAAMLAVAWVFRDNMHLLIGEVFEAPGVTAINAGSVSLALGDVLLFKTSKGHRGAIRFDRMTRDGGADYTGWFIPAESTVSFARAKPTAAHVFEKYWRTRESSGYLVKDIGGDYHVRCGPLAIPWSASTHLYMPSGYKFAVHSKNSPTGPSFDSGDLKWYVANVQGASQPVSEAEEKSPNN